MLKSMSMCREMLTRSSKDGLFNIYLHAFLLSRCLSAGGKNTYRTSVRAMTRMITKMITNKGKFHELYVSAECKNKPAKLRAKHRGAASPELEK